MNPCQYKDLFGKPNEGLRKKLRLFDISLVDAVPAIILGLFLSKIFNTTKINGVIVVILLGIFFHKLFCVETTLNKLLF